MRAKLLRKLRKTTTIEYIPSLGEYHVVSKHKSWHYQRRVFNNVEDAILFRKVAMITKGHFFYSNKRKSIKIK